MLEAPKIILKICQNLNSAIYLPEENGKLIHSWENILMDSYIAHPVLSYQPLETPALVLYIHGSSFVKEGIWNAQYVTVTDFEVLKIIPRNSGVN